MLSGSPIPETYPFLIGAVVLAFPWFQRSNPECHVNVTSPDNPGEIIDSVGQYLKCQCGRTTTVNGSCSFPKPCQLYF